MTAVARDDQAPEWQAWVAENLMRGVAPYAMVEAMVESGLARPVAERAVADAEAHPYLQAARVVAAEVAATQAAVDRAADAAAQASGAMRAKKYGWFLEVQRRAARQSTTYGAVARVRNLSADEFLERFYARNRPCVIEGAMADWPALERWQSPEYLKSRCGDELVEVQSRRDGSDLSLSASTFAKELPFREFVDTVEGGIEGNDWYMTANNGAKNLEAMLPLLDDLRYPAYLIPDPTQTFLWYGQKGIVTEIHHDLTNNLMAQVRGRKHVRLIAPFESAHVYNHEHRYSQIDAFDIDVERFPAMADVNVMDVEIGPGEMLFVPAGWWHAVKGLDVTMTLTLMHFAFDNDFHSFYETYGPI